MTEIIQFLIRYWKYISIAVVVLVNIILWFVKKKPVEVVDSIPGNILLFLPGLILKAEQLYPSGHGAEKLKYVVDHCISIVSKQFPEVNIDNYTDFITKSVEFILSTPQKKGD